MNIDYFYLYRIKTDKLQKKNLISSFFSVIIVESESQSKT